MKYCWLSCSCTLNKIIKRDIIQFSKLLYEWYHSTGINNQSCMYITICVVVFVPTIGHQLVWPYIAQRERERERNRERNGEREREMGRKGERQRHRERRTNGQTDNQTDWQTDRQTVCVREREGGGQNIFCIYCDNNMSVLVDISSGPITRAIINSQNKTQCPVLLHNISVSNTYHFPWRPYWPWWNKCPYRHSLYTVSMSYKDNHPSSSTRYHIQQRRMSYMVQCCWLDKNQQYSAYVLTERVFQVKNDI